MGWGRGGVALFVEFVGVGVVGVVFAILSARSLPVGVGCLSVKGVGMVFWLALTRSWSVMLASCTVLLVISALTGACRTDILLAVRSLSSPFPGLVEARFSCPVIFLVLTTNANIMSTVASFIVSGRLQFCWLVVSVLLRVAAVFSLVTVVRPDG